MLSHIKSFDSTGFFEMRELVDWQHRSVTVYGKSYPQPRLTCWYGPVPYTYSGLTWPARTAPIGESEFGQRGAVALADGLVCPDHRGPVAL
jgi:hypothetical protein